MSHEKILSQVLNSAIIVFVLGIIGTGILFLFKLLTARYFSPSEYGLFEMIITILGLLMIVANIGLKTGVSRFIPYYKSQNQLPKLRGFIRFSLAVPFIISLLLCVLVILAADYVTAFFNFPAEFSMYLYMMAIYIPFRALNTILVTMFVAYKRVFLAHFGVNVIEKVVLLVGIAIIMLKDLSLFWLIFVYGLSIILPFIYHIFVGINIFDFSPKTSYLSKQWLTFSLPLLLTGVFSYILNWTDNMTIAKFLTESDLGIYAVMFSLANYTLYLPSLLNVIFVPLLTEMYAKKNDFSKIFERVKIWGFTLALFFGSLVMVFSTQLISLLFGSEYVPGAKALVILTFFFLFTSYFSYYNALLLLKKKTSFIFYNTLIFSLLNLGLNIGLLLIFKNIYVVAISSGLTFLLIRFSEYVKSRSLFEVNLHVVHLVKLVVASILTHIILTFIFVWVNYIPFVSLKLIVLLGFYAVIYAVMLSLFRTFTKDDYIIIELFEKKIGRKIPFIRLLWRE